MKDYTMHLISSLIHALPVADRRCFDRKEAASYVGVSVTTFDKLVRDHRMPEPIKLHGRKVWDRRALDAAVDATMVGSKFSKASNETDTVGVSALDQWRASHG